MRYVVNSPPRQETKAMADVDLEPDFTLSIDFAVVHPLNGPRHLVHTGPDCHPECVAYRAEVEARNE
jgi:hypothetical protein